jgi:O-antigen/teichoic acid export membrane protein
LKGYKSIAVFVRGHPGAIAGWYQQGCSALTAVVCVPILIKYIGSTQTGIWLTFQSLAALAGLADFGFGYVTSRQVAFALGGGKVGKISSDIDMGQVGWQGVLNTLAMARFLNFWSCILGVFLMVGIGGGVIYSGKFSILPPFDIIKIWVALAISAAVLMLSKPDIALLEGVGRLTTARYIVGTQTLISGLGVCVIAVLGGGLDLMALAFCISAGFSLLVLRFISNRQFRDRALKPPDFKRAQLRRMTVVAFPLGLVNVGSYLFSSTQVPVIALFLSPAVVAPFYLAQRVGQFVNILVLQMLFPKLPEFSSLLGRGDYRNSKFLMEQTIKQVAFFSVLVCVCYVVGFPLLAKYVFRVDVLPLYLLLLMAFDYLLMNVSVSWGYFVISSGSNPFLMPTLLTGCANLCFLYFLLPHLGLIGLPASSLLAGMLVSYWYNIRAGLCLRRKLLEESLCVIY